MIVYVALAAILLAAAIGLTYVHWALYSPPPEAEDGRTGFSERW